MVSNYKIVAVLVNCLHYRFVCGLENQLAVACKAMPLGHTAAQRLTEQLRPRVVEVVAPALERPDAELGPILPGLALASAQHETQYSRLFRS